MKKVIFSVFATIVAMTALVSCDKDEYMAAEPQACFFIIVDETHINLYDQYGILCEENREVEFKIYTQFGLSVFATTPVHPLSDEEMNKSVSYMGEEVQHTPDGGAVFVIHYNHFDNLLKVYGLYMETKDAMGQTFPVMCLDDLRLKGKIETTELRETPFLQKGQICYTLEKDSLVLATAVQEISVYGNVEF